ncbi:MAG TPA: hypothetical protein VLG10_13565 [Methylomirabilota bacterium]|nr:hypothetical protein [Methylomirabilota bacterium]
MKPESSAHIELVQRLTTLTERVSRVSLTLAEAGRNLMERRALPPDTLVDEMAAVHTDFADLRDRVTAAAATLAAGAPPPITTLRELEVLVNVLVEEDVRRARRQPAEEGPSAAAEDATPIAEARGKSDERHGAAVAEGTHPRGGEDSRRKAHDEARRKAAEAEEAWRRAEAEAKRRAGEEAQRRAAEDARRRAEDEARRKAAEAEDARRRAEAESRRNAVVAEEGRRKAAEAEAKRRAEEDARRRAEEEARRKAMEAEASRKAAEAKRKADQDAQQEAQERAAEDARRRAQEEARQKAAEAEANRKAAEAKRKADQDAQQEAQERAAEDARRQAEEKARQNAEEIPVEIAEPVAATEDETADAGLETAQWWISASANWSSMRSKKVSFPAAVSDVLTKYPYFLSVPIQTSADYEDGMLAYGYGILLEHIEQRIPNFVSDALARLPARPGVSLGRRLYDYLAQALGVEYGDFIKAVMLASLPKTLPWATGGIEDGDLTTTVFVRPSARIGDTHQKAERFTQPHQRFGEHHFTAAVAPLTTRFFRVEAPDVKEARHLGLRVSEKGVPSDQAWVVSVAGRGGAPQARRHLPQGTVINGLGRECTAVWVGLFNADAENEKRYDITVEVTRRQPSTAGFRKR